MNNNKVDAKVFNANDYLSFDDHINDAPHLHGIVSISRENIKTGEKEFVGKSDNVISISGYQWVLMKMFGLYLDSNHNVSHETLNRDTNLIVPDLNASGTYQLGIDPSKYTLMDTDISDRHFIQGFMIGNGGSGEDTVSTKNTNYSFTKLRNPIPFQQTQTALPADIVGQYLGKLRVGSSSFSKSYYIKKFSETPHIYHSWWRDGQRWDYVDPVTQNDLGPDAVNGTGKTNRIETYAECKMSLSEDDCIAYFSHDGSTQTAFVNELGLVAFDTVPGERSIVETLYTKKIKPMLEIIYDNNRTADMISYMVELAIDVYTIISTLTSYGQSNINNFIDTVNEISGYPKDSTKINFTELQTTLSSETNIGVEAFYNQNKTFMYLTDKFIEYMGDEVFDTLATDEAQRIKLVTYYTFTSIPLQTNWKILIDYRIYAN